MSTVLGLAMAMINELNARIRNTTKYGFNLVFQVVENPESELIFSVAVLSFRFQ